eukprot:TRINITY_DN3176_c0_g2_i2.p1 TRINITY_DN3176_c0_g2~~TRINITY_DN3176_c0_g2_i2.p1  ORF type:complete len:1096 (-),score=309.72 TRINITY_DN3176_c0_g2_i2:111-2912(-)
MSDSGLLVSFPIPNSPYYHSPEMIATKFSQNKERQNNKLSTTTSAITTTTKLYTKSETWMIGLIALYIVCRISEPSHFFDKVNLDTILVNNNNDSNNNKSSKRIFLELLKIMKFSGYDDGFLQLLGNQLFDNNDGSDNNTNKFLDMLEKELSIMHQKQDKLFYNTNINNNNNNNSDDKNSTTINGFLNHNNNEDNNNYNPHVENMLKDLNIPEDLKMFILESLTISPSHRPDPNQLKSSHPLFNDIRNKKVSSSSSSSSSSSYWVKKPKLKSLNENVIHHHHQHQQHHQHHKQAENHGREFVVNEEYELTITELFQFWTISGGDLEDAILGGDGNDSDEHHHNNNDKDDVSENLFMPPNILRLPSYVMIGDSSGTNSNNNKLNQSSQNMLFLSLQDSSRSYHHNKYFHISVEDLIESLGGDIHVHLNPIKSTTTTTTKPSNKKDSIEYHDDHENEHEHFSEGGQSSSSSSSSTSSSSSSTTTAPTLSDRESNFDYQIKRMRKFKKLLVEYPTSRARIIKEASRDIPPLLRPQIWSSILGVDSCDKSIQKMWNAVDFSKEHPSDYQISLDVPRCHQYHPLLSSPIGQHKLNTILKAWVRINPELNYWQGVDSLLAPFLVLNFNNEPRALFCLQEVVELFLRPFFLKNKTVYLQEHLAMFQHILAYIDPELAVHLHDIGASADLYAIPWFLTMFTHIFSVDKISRIWDTVLISPPSLPLFLATSILLQIKQLILPLDFNSFIILFSSMPPINIDQSISQSKKFLQNTPPSITTPHYTIDAEEERSHHEPKSKSSGKGAHHPHHQQHHGRWWEVRPSLDQLKLELFPRISVNDLVNSKAVTLILDVRPEDEFKYIHFPQSLNVKNVKEITPTTFANLLSGKRTMMIAVIGKKDDSISTQFTNDLVRAHYKFVSLVNGGIDSLRADAEGLLEGTWRT